MGKQRKKHETSHEQQQEGKHMNKNRKESMDPSYKNYTAIHLIEGKFRVEIKHNENGGYTHRNCSNNLSEKIPNFRVIIGILWSLRPPLFYLIASSVSSSQCADLSLSHHLSFHPRLRQISTNLSFASISTVGPTLPIKAGSQSDGHFSARPIKYTRTTLTVDLYT